MKMKAKNNKMMLALLVVAALAICSVAVVANADDSDAAGTSIIDASQVSTQVITSETGEVNYDVYVPFSTTTGVLQINSTHNVVFTISADADYSGTIRFGTYDKATGEFVPASVVVLDGVSSATVTFSVVTEDSTHYTTISDVAVVSTIPGVNSASSTSGTITVSEGSVQLGSGSYFSGTVVANDSELVSANTYGVTISSDNNITGAVSAGAQKYYKSASAGYVTVTPVLTVGGTATMGTFTVGSGVDFVIDSDATVTMPANASEYSIESGATTFKLNLVGADSDNVVGAIYDSYGQEIAYVTDATGGVITFAFTDGRGIDTTQTYTMNLMMTTGTTLKSYYLYDGTVSFTVTSTTATTGVITYTAAVTISGSSTLSVATVNTGYSIVGSSNLAGLTTTDGTNYYLSYDVSTYALAYAVVGSTNVMDSDLNGSISLGTSITPGNPVMIILQDKSTGSWVVFVGKIASTTTSGVYAVSYDTTVAVAYLMSSTTTLSGITGQIQSGTTVGTATRTSSTVTPAVSSGLTVTDQMYTLTVSAGGKLDVDGELNFNFASVISYGKLSNSGTINVDGIIAYQIAKATGYTTQITATINAVSYKVAATTTSQVYDTYYYTTLDNAMSNASNLYVYGTITVLKDTTLTGTPTGTSSSPNTITLETGAVLIIGQIADTTTGITAITAVVTVPSTSKLITMGNVNVKNGQLDIAGLTSDSGYSVTADVFMTYSSYGVYTDLATALDLATSGDTVNVRTTAATTITLADSATVASGVLLNAATNNIVVDAGITFTVSGVIKVGTITVNAATAVSGSTPAKAAGVLVLDKYSTQTVITNITTAGTVTFTSNFSNGATADSAFAISTITINGATKATSSVINVNGNVKLSISTWVGGTSSSDQKYMIVNVNGTLTTVSAMDVDTLYAVVNVPGTLTANANFGASELNVTGTALPKDSSVVIWANYLTVGTAPTTLTDVENDAKVTAKVGAYAIVYGTTTTGNVTLYQSVSGYTLLTTSTAYYLNTDVLYAKIYANDATAISVIGNPAIVGNLFYGWYLEPTFQTVSSGNVGDHTSIYGKLVLKTTTITLSYTQNGYWMVNGNVYAGNTVTIDWATSYSISFIADDGYELKDYAIYVNGSAMPVGYTPTTGDVLTFNGTVEAKTISEDTSMEITTILLIIITIVIIIMAIVIVLRLMRS
jgi:hypothetical protein